jgi:hypothetical protein
VLLSEIIEASPNCRQGEIWLPQPLAFFKRFQHRAQPCGGLGAIFTASALQGAPKEVSHRDTEKKEEKKIRQGSREGRKRKNRFFFLPGILSSLAISLVVCLSLLCVCVVPLL